MMVWLAAAATPSFVSAGVPDWAWDLKPREGRVYFLAFCPRMMDRDEEARECLAAASCQAAKYERVTVMAGRFRKRVLLFTRHTNSVALTFDETRARELQAGLVALHEQRSEEGTYILFGIEQHTLKDTGLYEAPDLGPGPDPGWIEKGYLLPGYYTAVGVAQKKRLFSDSIEAADNDALVGLALQLSSEVDSGLLDSTRRPPGRYGSEKTAATIRGFLVIARAVSEDSRFYYSLAVCPKNRNRE